MLVFGNFWFHAVIKFWLYFLTMKSLVLFCQGYCYERGFGFLNIFWVKVSENQGIMGGKFEYRFCYLGIFLSKVFLHIEMWRGKVF